ncbi:hypothetical protein ECHHL_0534 [Ehrlichia chaffeensis str. Heartland]|uniref:Uncharacterized protein n=1 Tax=Ehrlichia chaffeensis (strain ATCC CRL-10679 / Arkansas) TaxID=205920 RepID=Q2GGL3_EHRCR|nr:hypothetical protein ECH_0610 [Ehrlichia chaffeensis str. Arkansas]AHX03691.1 hypothetical protein ECHHL_0534 [Ehrlichia chaffeensis str. Heartland]AHX07749.1 hypothetical protein ECHOSC_0542 [Ehrlichia chaffeensis str. Osceola]AHX08988.1 hypothetical protein ECHSTV_0512 [Ehrlichia chaffeensis str. Saint Vincent]AHX09286.1 hypothetical protein ECHWAK_0518 [Ehrlichia chaffeensis str. Wakulla]AHX10493.1 hypothetical protein ECHWP_0531 [Ehrlichia chaffeensis str. West Paces]
MFEELINSIDFFVQDYIILLVKNIVTLSYLLINVKEHLMYILSSY